MSSWEEYRVLVRLERAAFNKYLAMSLAWAHEASKSSEVERLRQEWIFAERALSEHPESKRGLGK